MGSGKTFLLKNNNKIWSIMWSKRILKTPAKTSWSAGKSRLSHTTNSTTGIYALWGIRCTIIWEWAEEALKLPVISSWSLKKRRELRNWWILCFRSGTQWKLPKSGSISLKDRSQPNGNNSNCLDKQRHLFMINKIIF